MQGSHGHHGRRKLRARLVKLVAERRTLVSATTVRLTHGEVCRGFRTLRFMRCLRAQLVTLPRELRLPSCVEPLRVGPQVGLMATALIRHRLLGRAPALDGGVAIGNRIGQEVRPLPCLLSVMCALTPLGTQLLLNLPAPRSLICQLRVRLAARRARLGRLALHTTDLVVKPPRLLLRLQACRFACLHAALGCEGALVRLPHLTPGHQRLRASGLRLTTRRFGLTAQQLHLALQRCADLRLRSLDLCVRRILRLDLARRMRPRGKLTLQRLTRRGLAPARIGHGGLRPCETRLQLRPCLQLALQRLRGHRLAPHRLRGVGHRLLALSLHLSPIRSLLQVVLAHRRRLQLKLSP